MDKEELVKEVVSLIKRSNGGCTAIEALQYSQAALNAANALTQVYMIIGKWPLTGSNIGV